MFSRSSRTKRVAKPAKVTIVKPEQSKNDAIKPALDLSKAKITIIKPKKGLTIMVDEEENEGEDE